MRPDHFQNTYILAFDHKQATMINESQIVIAEKEKLQWLTTKKKENNQCHDCLKVTENQRSNSIDYNKNTFSIKIYSGEWIFIGA